MSVSPDAKIHLLDNFDVSYYTTCMETKCCSVCDKTKPVTDFYTTRPRKDGTTSYRADCKECVKKRSKKWRDEHPQKRRGIALRYYRKIRLEALLHYSSGSLKCACCGEGHIEFLAIDHIDGDGAAHRRKIGKTRAMFQWLKNNSYPPGFQVLCHNCNWAKGTNKTCPHELERQGEYDPVNIDAALNPILPYTSQNRIITYNDRTQSLQEWANETGIRGSTISLRLDRYKWTIEKALTVPPSARNRKDAIILTYKGQAYTLPEWAEITGISRQTLWNRTQRAGWSVHDALTRPPGEK